MASKCTVAEPLLPAYNQPCVDASNTINKDQLGWQRRLGGPYWLPVFQGNFDIKGHGFVRSFNIVE
jgi:hypothetical protein